MNPKLEPNIHDIHGVLVYLEKRRTRIFVGTLTGELNTNKKQFYFEYDLKYLNSKAVIPLGPELPLTQQYYQSSTLFTAFQDRIPSKDNPAYLDYCKALEISEQENDPFVLLCTIGKKGPSSFIFEPLFLEHFSPADLKKFREELGLTLREFASLFDLSFSHLQRIESKKFSGKEILKRIETYQKFPEIALFEILRRGGVLHSDKKYELIQFFKQKITNSLP